VILEELEGAESNGGLGNGAVDEDGKAAVEALHPVLVNGL